MKPPSMKVSMQLTSTKTRQKKFEARVRAWKLKEEKTHEEYQSIVKDKVAEAVWKYLDVHEHWQQMKKYNDGNSTGHMWIVKRTMQT